MNDWKIDEMDVLIKRLRQLAEELKEKSGGIQAVDRNVERILANVKMLELNISDVRDLLS
jgi:predicted component of type VI protein secretion system